MVDRVPAEEWAQIFDEVWRRYRDFFYVDEHARLRLGGARATQYRPLLAHVAHRSDLNYVHRRDDRRAQRPARLRRGRRLRDRRRGRGWRCPARASSSTEGRRRYRIAKIFAGQNEEERYRSPLTEIGVDAQVGDYVLAIDGEELTANDDPYRLLRNKADRPVTLTLNDEPDGDGRAQGHVPADHDARTT